MTADEIEGNPVRVFGLLAAEQRLRVFAAVLLGARSSSQASQQAGTSVRETLRALSQLQRGGLVSRSGTDWIAHPEVLRAAVAVTAAEEKSKDHSAADSPGAALLGAFIQGGRLVRMPANRSKRLAVLDHLAQLFEPGVTYREQEVNAMLRQFNDDYAALRRYLVDDGFLIRESGQYWRVGGSVEV